MDWATTPSTSGLKSQTPWNTISATQLCGVILLRSKINSVKFKEAVGMDNHCWGAGHASQINHPRCEQNFQVAFLHILFSWASLKLKSLFICNILAPESFLFSKYSLIPHNPFIVFYFPAIPPPICISKAYCAQAHLEAELEFWLQLPPRGSGESGVPLDPAEPAPGTETCWWRGSHSGLGAALRHLSCSTPIFISPIEVFAWARTANSLIAAVSHINST